MGRHDEHYLSRPRASPSPPQRPTILQDRQGNTGLRWWTARFGLLSRHRMG
jgi:hypothetical protein